MLSLENNAFNSLDNDKYMVCGQLQNWIYMLHNYRNGIMFLK